VLSRSLLKKNLSFRILHLCLLLIHLGFPLFSCFLCLCSTSVSKLSDPPIEPYLKPVDYVNTLAEIYVQLETAAEEDKATLYLEQSCVFRGLGETKLLRRSLRSARQHAVTIHDKLVYAAWLKYEKRDEELNDGTPNFCSGRKLECLQSVLTPGLSMDHPTDPCACRCPPGETSSHGGEYIPYNSFVNDIVFHLGGDQVPCNRQKIAALSFAFQTMLNGDFREARISDIMFAGNGISVTGLRAVDHFSKTGRLARLSPEMLLEILSFANRFCCDTLKDACDQNLASFVRSGDDVLTFLDYALEESAQALVGACLQVFFRELPGSLKSLRQIIDILSTPEGQDKFARVGHTSFALFAFLTQISMEESMCSDRTVALLEGQKRCVASQRQRQLACHQLGCVLFARKQYSKALVYFEAAVLEGHVYSWAGVVRIKSYKGLRATAYEESAAVVANYKPSGWMFQERALYSDGNEKLADLTKATELDPTLAYPYKYRAAALMDEQKVQAAITEINRILGFKVTSDCLELRAYFCLALQEYEGAVRDVRALLTLDPSYMMYAGRLGANQLLRLLSQHVEQWSKADCWMQLYDRWSSVDDIGSLAVVHQMLESDPRKGLLFFRQSLLLLRWVYIFFTVVVNFVVLSLGTTTLLSH
jgi:tetratricopeptide (TPR) repeat protein